MTPDLWELAKFPFINFAEPQMLFIASAWTVMLHSSSYLKKRELKSRNIAH